MDSRPIDPHSDSPPSRQIVERVLDAVARGELTAGDRLPSVRALAADALVNPNTVGKAYRELESLGVTAGKNGSGVYVTARGPAIARRLRQATTLDAFEAAAASALLAGHDQQVLTSIIETLAESINTNRDRVKS